MTDRDLHVPQAVKKGYISCPPGGVFDISYPHSKLRRARVQGGGQNIIRNNLQYRDVSVYSL